jgi:transposase
MLSVSVSACVDVGQTWLDLGFFPSAKPLRAPNTPDGIEKIIAALRSKGAVKVVLEATGSYARKLVCALVAAGIPVFVVNPRRIKAFRDAEGLIAKTDRLGAALIARFAHKMSHDLRPPPDTELLTLKALSARRRQLTELAAMEKTRLKQASDEIVIASCKELVAVIDEKCAVIEEEIARLVTSDARLSRRRDILLSIPGVGKRISTLVVIEMPELGEIDRKAAASLVGVAPHPSQSGLSKGRNAIAGGRPCLPAAFYMAALVAARTHPKFKQLYKDMRTSGPPPKVALVAIARRIVTLANALVRDNVDFDESAFAS